MALLGELTYALVATGRTDIGGLIPDVTVDEVPRDDLVITDHPVERGAAITDHAFKLPTRIDMRLGWSNASAGAEGYVEAVYEEMLRLQGVREPFDIYTPRRFYPSMLVQSITAPRDERTNAILFLSVVFRQIIIAYTRQAASGASGISPDAAQQAMPETTGGIVEQGSLQPLDEQQFAGQYTDLPGVGPDGRFETSSVPDDLGEIGGLSGLDEVTFSDPSSALYSGTSLPTGWNALPAGTAVAGASPFAPGAFGRAA